jgi:hypothetical protein
MCLSICLLYFKEETLLKSLVEQQHNWVDIASRFVGRTNGQCMERYVCDFTRLIVHKHLTYSARWKNQVNPDINFADFSADEQATILAGQSEGKTWVDIANTLTGSKPTYRRPNQVKNFHCALRIS